MRAIRFHGVGDLRCEEVPEPGNPPPGFALLRVLAAGICGSDLHNYQTGQWIAGLPVTPGHEFCAEVLAVGSGVNGVVAGDHVVVDSRANCGECDYCLRGQGNLCRRMGFVGEVCDGGFAEQTLQPAHRLIKVSADVSAEVAALAEPLGVALRVLRRLNAPAGEPVLVAGGGPIGGLAALLMRELDDRPVLLIERNEIRAALLKDVAGVQHVALDADCIREACGGTEPRYAIEATGSGAVLGGVLDAIGSGGRVALVGLFHGAPTLNTNALVEREIDLVGCSVFQDEQQDAVALLPRLAAKLSRLVSAPIELADVPSAYRILLRGEAGTLKTIVKP